MTTFNELQAEAYRRGFTLERGSKERSHGARSGYVVTARGLWRRLGTLGEVERYMERRGYDYAALRRREEGEPQP